MTGNETKIKLRNLHIAPRKVRLVASLVKGMPVEEALAQLTLNSARPSGPLVKLIRSGVANARNKGMKIEHMIVKSVMVDGGPMMKRILPRAMGRGTPIHKKMSHITIVLAESAVSKPVRFDLTKADKKPKKEHKHTKSEKTKAANEDKVSHEKASNKPGFFKKVFQRKSI